MDHQFEKIGAVELEELLPLEAIRQHTKTEDIPAVSDWQLRLYRKAAFEAAEKYTGFLVTERKMITELVPDPTSSSYRQGFFWYTVSAPFAQPLAYYYGAKNEPPRAIQVVVGERRIKLPVMHSDFGMGCCNPCAEPTGARLLYATGPRCNGEIPATLLLGVLKYIAHVVENPGDFATSANSQGKQTSAQTDLALANNPAFASGAIEIWRSMLDDAI